jgi:hypothetical protein
MSAMPVGACLAVILGNWYTPISFYKLCGSRTTLMHLSRKGMAGATMKAENLSVSEGHAKARILW